MKDITDADCKYFLKKIRKISRFVSSKWYIMVSWYIWEL